MEHGPVFSHLVGAGARRAAELDERRRLLNFRRWGRPIWDARNGANAEPNAKAGMGGAAKAGCDIAQSGSRAVQRGSTMEPRRQARSLV